ncbi:cofactor-independent phosphoglycerate mutase [Dehalobacterium formicoaceticum]|uniref:Cofactor-independent phosphoglycerate mutase n=1 Tax=Dehalobacterium formicoaceticum TaxID=51515 RepID=A0ABT1XZR3_9FIRM|nr:cofactor-independent phosphoglycerate mutase [Dehalobacterium formicoaceticum]MCR6544107.1 cofactor-independent phosphoglycerate mutase [Dehalobacterium formicoaceticum]
MKYIVILGDGMADYPLAAYDHKTPLQLAHKPYIDQLVKSSETGMVQTIPEGYPPGSDVANMSVLGYEPEIFYTGRSPLEAVSLGVDLREKDIAFRCNLVTLSLEENYGDKTMLDYSAGEITSAEAALLIQEISKEIGTEEFHFYPGISYRHLMVWINGAWEFDLTPPHDISDRVIGSYLPKGAGSDVLTRMMIKSEEILKNHPVNQKRKELGLQPATSIWLWGLGKKPNFTPFVNKYGLEGSVICAVDLIKGLGICAGLNTPHVDGATGGVHTDFLAKAEAALAELKAGKDFIYLHVEAPDEAGHQGNAQEKIGAIEKIDELVVGRLLRGLEEMKEDYRLLILPDHPTPISIKTHTAEPVPFLIYDSRRNVSSGINRYTEEEISAQGNFVKSGPALMAKFIKGE